MLGSLKLLRLLGLIVKYLFIEFFIFYPKLESFKACEKAQVK